MFCDHVLAVVTMGHNIQNAVYRGHLRNNFRGCNAIGILRHWTDKESKKDLRHRGPLTVRSAVFCFVSKGAQEVYLEAENRAELELEHYKPKSHVF